MANLCLLGYRDHILAIYQPFVCHCLDHCGDDFVDHFFVTFWIPFGDHFGSHFRTKASKTKESYIFKKVVFALDYLHFFALEASQRTPKPQKKGIQN